MLARLPVPGELAVGRLGLQSFPAGCYAYAGSALGPGGLQARLSRHLRACKRMHWHIDYLLRVAVLAKSWQVHSSERLECEWAASIAELPHARVLVPGFGASDCRCPGHLVYLGWHPSNAQIESALRQAVRRRGLDPDSHPLLYTRYPIVTAR